MTAGNHRQFDHVVGGEQPLTPAEAEHWLSPGENSPRPDATILARLGCSENSALWLRYGRSALGLALRLTGAAQHGGVAISDYQCHAVVDRLLAYTGKVIFYPVEEALTPEPETLLSASRRVDAVITCSYFGSAAVDVALGDIAPRISGLPNRPWIIEDRAMAFPEPASIAKASARCDFVVLSLRKIYPLPDGAVLAACSDRARAALAEWRATRPAPSNDAADRAAKHKVLAKVRRDAWIKTTPIFDDASVNGLPESIASEKLVDTVADNEALEGLNGSAGSAHYLLQRDLAADLAAVRNRSARLIAGLSDAAQGDMPVVDGLGLAVPMLAPDRKSLIGQAAADGIFLLVHWPLHPELKPGPAARRWYDQAVSFPALPARPDTDVEHMIARLAPHPGLRRA